MGSDYNRASRLPSVATYKRIPVTHQSNRRQFAKTFAAAGGVITASALGYSKVLGANERLRIASVGTGGKGWSDLNGVAASPAVEVAALCDIDSSEPHLGRAATRYPEARRYADWRKLFDESNDIDGVIVSTPDFMHAPISLPAMELGKHVFCQKPLTHSVEEARQMNEAAKKNQVVTQMGNQIQSHTAYRTAVKIVHEGLIGKVKSVHSWQGGQPRWPRHIERPEGSDPVPKHVRWDLWQGVAPRRPYKDDLYHPFNWRGWRDYGTGQLGDFGCHILDPVFMAIGLTAPKSLVAEAPPIKPDTWTDAATVHYLFPGTDRTAEDQLQVTWYDAAGVTPPREQLGDVPKDYKLPKAGSVLVGEKGSLVIPHVSTPRLFPEEAFPADRVPQVEGVDHYVQWADACRGMDKATSSFDYSGPLTETVLLGTIGIRHPEKTLHWDSAKGKITNNDQANAMVTKEYVAF